MRRGVHKKRRRWCVATTSYRLRGLLRRLERYCVKQCDCGNTHTHKRSAHIHGPLNRTSGRNSYVNTYVPLSQPSILQRGIAEHGALFAHDFFCSLAICLWKIGLSLTPPIVHARPMHSSCHTNRLLQIIMNQVPCFWIHRRDSSPEGLSKQVSNHNKQKNKNKSQPRQSHPQAGAIIQTTSSSGMKRHTTTPSSASPVTDVSKGGGFS